MSLTSTGVRNLVVFCFAWGAFSACSSSSSDGIDAGTPDTGQPTDLVGEAAMDLALHETTKDVPNAPDVPADLTSDVLQDVPADLPLDVPAELVSDLVPEVAPELIDELISDLPEDIPETADLVQEVVADIVPPCPDADLDGVCDADDICPEGDDNLDTDGDGIPNDCDDCDSPDDSDGDGVVDDCDSCPGFNDAIDENENGIPDGCEACFPDPCKHKEHSSCDPYTGSCACKDGWCDIDDLCVEDGDLHPDASCLICDLEIAKQEWTLRAAGSQCRAPVGECDLPEVCDGESDDCPADLMVDSSVPCGAEADLCSAQDTCNGNGVCQPNHLTAGAVCGDADDYCLVPDTCDGQGQCVDNAYSDVGTFCGDGPTECSAQDACDGEGFCVPNDFDQGHPCGDAASQCLLQDQCDGLGTCEDMGTVEPGTPCGDDASECSLQDTCDQQGFCATNHVEAGTNCGDDGAACVVQDTCDGHGQCADHGFLEPGTVCGDEATACSEQDVCDGAGNCQPLDLDPGTACDDGLSHTYGDACDATLACIGHTFATCLDALNSGQMESGLYWLDPDGIGPLVSFQAWCDMETAGGGWTLVAVYGDSGRPQQWVGGDYPRPGASAYGTPAGTIFDAQANNVEVQNYSMDASFLWSLGGADAMVYVGGATDDYALANLPGGCNPFDPTTICAENTWGPFPVFASDGTRLAENAFACTTAHGQPPYQDDPYDEFGLQLLDGQDGINEFHCHQGDSNLGHQGLGRIFVTLEGAGTDGWSQGVHSHWALTGDYNQPGALLLRESTDCVDRDFDAVCADQDLCPQQYDPGQEDINQNGIGDACEHFDCLAIKKAGADSGDGLYFIDPDGPGGDAPFQVYCDMTVAGGGWTLAAVYGTDVRPEEWTGNDYPRPAASNYGAIDPGVFDADNNDGPIGSYSVDAAAFVDDAGIQVMAYVGGSTDDYVLASLPAGCNFFDGSSVCQENTYGPFYLYRSDSTVVTDSAFACTTAHGGPGFEGDLADEFGLHLLDGGDDQSDLHCNVGVGASGHEGLGRLFSTFEQSDGTHWAEGVHSHWSATGQADVPGALFVRRTDTCPDSDLDGVCDEADICPHAMDPEQADDNENGIGDACEPRDCLAILESGQAQVDGLYWVDPDGPGGNPAHQTLCSMTMAGGGWTAAAIYGLDGRPTQWTGSDYPRPGGSVYGAPTMSIMSQATNDCCIMNFSIDVSSLWGPEGLEVLTWVGGSTDDFVITALPPGCNFFAADSVCAEDATGPLEVKRSDGSLLTDNGYACTTAHGADPYGDDPFDEFGLHLLDGQDDLAEFHCNRGSTGLGHEGLGRIFTTFEASNFYPNPWTEGIVSHWADDGQARVPGALFVRSPDAECKDPDSDFICDDVDNCPGLPNGDQVDSDKDGVGDACDNCIDAPNTDQLQELDPVEGLCSEGFARYIRDQDQDGFPLPDQLRCICEMSPGAGWIPDENQPTDCDDTKATVYPNAPEFCNGLDDDCDLEIDEEGPLLDEQCPATYPKRYVDADEDGFGVVGGVPRCLCTGEGLHTSTKNTDCVDTDDQIKPGAKETCATPYDDNCNDNTNDKDATGCNVFYRDVDNDGYGGSGACHCVATSSYYLATSTDCNDSKAYVNPGAPENCNTGDDDDCDGSTNDENADNCTHFYWDADEDGYYPSDAPSKCLCKGYGQVSSTKSGDCCGTDPNAYPGSPNVSMFKNFCGQYDFNCDGKSTKVHTKIMELVWWAPPGEYVFTHCINHIVWCDGQAEVKSEGYLGWIPDCGDKNLWVNSQPQYYHTDDCWCYYFVFGCDGPYCDWKGDQRWQQCY